MGLDKEPGELAHYSPKCDNESLLSSLFAAGQDSIHMQMRIDQLQKEEEEQKIFQMSFIQWS